MNRTEATRGVSKSGEGEGHGEQSGPSGFLCVYDARGGVRLITDVRPVSSLSYAPTGSPGAVGCPLVGARRCLRVFAIGPRQAEAQSAVQSKCFCKARYPDYQKDYGSYSALIGGKRSIK